MSTTRGPRNPIWLHVYSGWRWFETAPGADTKVARQGKVRLIRAGNRHHQLYIRKEELCAPYWLRTA